MTEDDTFDRLTQAPIQKCIDAYLCLINGLISFERFEEIIKRHKWTWTQFEKEYILK